MSRDGLIQEMERYRLVAVVRSKSSEEAIKTVEAVAEAGVKFVEITYSVPGAVTVIKELAKRGDLFVGAGTVLSNEQAEQAIAAGACFIVSPTLELNLIPICRKAGVVCVTGAATATEILTAMRAGTDLVKLFPADCLGGPNFVGQIANTFSGARFMVSGGVSLANVKEYVEVGVVGLALGSAFLRGVLSREGHSGLVQKVVPFVKLVQETRSGGNF
ncbi:bifunctional 4-hydroxy-2-oxoglutarate aldolase/2-dehydro-3-deoxy-phosphogluconate aldolase [bacterium]|nr:MAG: bifunctional 4-hydroxy-2-oxoglutarate aldolase/2-dehydro-3-deoxy-phosphogluconate aldolase [bacterium]